MKFRCPECRTLYEIENQPLAEVGGWVRCHVCGQTFNAYGKDSFASAEPPPKPGPAPGAVPSDSADTRAEQPLLAHPDSVELDRLDRRSFEEDILDINRFDESLLEESSIEESSLQVSAIEESSLQLGLLEEDHLEPGHFEPDRFKPDEFEQDHFEPDHFEPDEFEQDHLFEQDELEESLLGESLLEESTLEASSIDASSLALDHFYEGHPEEDHPKADRLDEDSSAEAISEADSLLPGNREQEVPVADGIEPARLGLDELPPEEVIEDAEPVRFDRLPDLDTSAAAGRAPARAAAEEPALPEIEPELELSMPSANPERQPAPFSWGQMAMTLVLGLLALAQLSWIERDDLLQYPLGRKWLVQLCNMAGCNVPEPTNDQAFRVLERELRSAPGPAKALRLRIVITNGASLERRPPLLQLSFTNRREQPIARRTFLPKEYLRASGIAERPLEPGQQLQAELLLQDPGPEAVGFRIEFL